mgnify:CR=1 FL=1
MQPQVNQVLETPTESLAHLLERMQTEFHRAPMPPVAQRKNRLKLLKKLLIDRQDLLLEAVSADFGHRCLHETLFAEIAQLIEEINYVSKHLSHWAKPQKQRLPLHLKPGQARIHYQPKGVVGILSPWNYPLLLSLGPLISAWSAGNRAIIKPSELTPNTNQCLSDLIERIDGAHAAVVTGDATVAEQLCRLPLDHLFFTGSSTIGRKVMAAAASNLTPVTLELGGKSPVLIDQHVDLDQACASIIFAKCLNAGQTCIAPDYVLCHQRMYEPFQRALLRIASKLYPTFRDNPDYSAIIDQRHFKRLQAMLLDAEQHGATLTSLEPQAKNASISRKIPLTLLTNCTDAMQAMQAEIFGPLLPIISIPSVQAGLDHIAARPKPLALYCFTTRQTVQRKVINTTHSGSLCINDAITQVAVPSLPFGGVGESGMGAYHGQAGFQELSHSKAVLVRQSVTPMILFTPPWGRSVHRLAKKWLLR